MPRSMNTVKHRERRSAAPARHEIRTVHAEGSFAAQKMMILMEAPMEMHKESANRIIGLDL